MAYTADVNRWRGPAEEPYRPHMLDCPWHPGWIAVTILGFIIWWPIGLALLFFTLGSRKMGCWSNQDRWSEQDGADAVQDGADAGRMERRGFGVRPALERQPRLRRIPHRKRCGASRRSRPSSGISSTACATPRTRKSSTSSWRSTIARPPTPPPHGHSPG